MSTSDNRNITDDLSDIETTVLMKALPNYLKFSDDVEHTAYLNWRFDGKAENDFFIMAKGYFDTSIELLNKCIDSNSDKKADVWIFPIMFDVVHGIEICLKGLNSLLQIYANLEKDDRLQHSKIECTHNIDKLCEDSINLLRDNNFSELLSEMLFVQKFIQILYQYTNDMTFARYPITAKEKNQFYVGTSDNVTIDLHVFRQWVLRIIMILDRVPFFIDMQVERIKDMRFEMLDYYNAYWD